MKRSLRQPIFSAAALCCSGFLCLLLTFCLFSAGCSGGGQAVQPAAAPPVSPDAGGSGRLLKMNDAMIKAAMMQPAESSTDFILGPEDLLEIEVFNADELRRVVRVNSQGTILLPLIGQVNTKGLTPIQLEREIEKDLLKYMQQPVVMVNIKEYRSHKIAVLGAVRNPNYYPVGGPRNLLNLLYMAGGLEKDAGGICYIIRTIKSENSFEVRTETTIIDLFELLEKANYTLNVPVYAGDVINVPRGGSIYIAGAVNKPGVYPLQGKVSVGQAVVIGGGFTFVADKSNVRIFRDNGTMQRDIYTVDYNEIHSGGKPDFMLKENDIIVFETSDLKSVLSFIGQTVSGAFTVGTVGMGVGY